MSLIDAKAERERLKRAILFLYSLGYNATQIGAVLEEKPKRIENILARARKEQVVFKEMADAMVEKAAFNSATGYTRTIEETKNGEKVSYEKYYPPNVQAQQFWLRNRKPQAWKDTREVEFKRSVKVLKDNELLEIAAEMGMNVEKLKPHETPAVLAEFEVKDGEDDTNKT